MSSRHHGVGSTTHLVLHMADVRLPGKPPSVKDDDHSKIIEAMHVIEDHKREGHGMSSEAAAVPPGRRRHQAGASASRRALEPPQVRRPGADKLRCRLKPRRRESAWRFPTAGC